MGIKNLHRILEKYASDCYKERDLSYFAFKKVAIDVSLYLYKFKAIYGHKWIECFLSMVVSLRKNDVHCIFIYDGKAPTEKIEEQYRRRESRAKMSDKISELENEIKIYEQTGEVGKMMEEISKKEGVVSLFRKVVPTVNIGVVKTKLESMKSMMISILPEDIKLTQDLFDVLHIPYLTAPAEAECYASLLCINGNVDCVMSEDTDVLAYGTPCFLTKLDTRSNKVVEITYSTILEETEMTKETFTDLCIMCSCDYNSNLPMIGHEKSYQLLKAYGDIEHVIEYLQSIKPLQYTDSACEILKYKRCREMFSSYPVTCDISYCGIPDFNEVELFLFQHSIYYSMALLRKNLSPRDIVLIDDEKNDTITLSTNKDE
jgi:flap endonuclease-1